MVVLCVQDSVFGIHGLGFDCDDGEYSGIQRLIDSVDGIAKHPWAVLVEWQSEGILERLLGAQEIWRAEEIQVTGDWSASFREFPGFDWILS